MHRLVVLVLAFTLVSGCSRGAEGADETTKLRPGQSTTDRAAREVPALKSWMRSNASTALDAQNFEKLASAFERMKTFAPAEREFESWPTIAGNGARAAASKNVEGVRQACQNCHEALRRAYRNLPHGRSS